MNHDNSFARSALPQPARSNLAEMSAAANNARPTGLVPPGTLGKRKTLAERAGEAPRPAPAPPGLRYNNSSVKTTTIAGAARQNSYSSTSTFSRPASNNSYRNASNSSFASTMSSRAPSAQSVRPQPTMSNHQKSKSMYGQPTAAYGQSGPEGQDGSNSIVNSFSSARQFSANTSRRKKPFVMESAQDDGFENGSESSCSDASTANFAMRGKSLRDISLSSAMGNMRIVSGSSLSRPVGRENAPPTPHTPSQIPKKKPSVPLFTAPSPSPAKSSPCKSPKRKKQTFLTKDSNLRSLDWDLGSRVENMESMYADLKKTMSATAEESTNLKENINLYKTRIVELEDAKKEAHRDNRELRDELDRMKQQISRQCLEMDKIRQINDLELSKANGRSDEMRRNHNSEMDEMERKLRKEVGQAIQDAEEEKRRIERSHRDELTDIKRKLEDALEQERDLRQKEVQQLSSEGDLAQQKVRDELQSKTKELEALNEELARSKEETAKEKETIAQEKAKVVNVKSQLDQANGTITSNESAIRSLRAHVEFLESDSKSQSQSFADLERKTQEAIREAEEARAKLRAEETLRRKLHNQVQELKGNIRVFCRVRPTLPHEETEKARISFPDDSADSKEVEIQGPDEKSSLGTITTKKNAFAFDRVFNPSSQNEEVFDEISQLVQSALDGYNVCIFCYGQTGSGKTYTMSSEDGMIPRAVNQIYQTAKSLEEKGWQYQMQGSFIEVYNESINDLLGKAEDFDKKKHEIRHDMQKCKTTITDITSVDLDSPGKVESALHKAMNNRSIAATKANERSSRSHTVFILKLTGENSISGEKSEGTLNLVDLAGSERLSHSGATGERLKETQNINKSLSCLGDVIGALGQGKEGGHIPYRNSKLTYLLQFSLGGNSKTLMFVMVSPLEAHLSETVTSLKFATKVHNTHIGTAKRQAKVRD